MEPYEGCIVDACNRGFLAFGKDYSKLRHNHSRVTDANILRDLLLAELRREFDGTVQGANLITVRGGLTVLTSRDRQSLALSDLIRPSVLETAIQAVLEIP